MSNTTRILLVEDDPDITHYVVAILKLATQVNHEVATARSLELAKEMYAEGTFDVVLLDLGLPDSDSPLATVRDAAAWTPEPCIVVLTSQASPELGLDAVRYGAHDFLLKSTITPPMLERVIAYARERHERRGRLLVKQELLNTQVTNLEAYVSSVSHDLRAPLASATMLLGLLRDRHADLTPEQVTEFLARADSAIVKGLEFADDLLEDARVGGEGRTPLDLPKLSRDAVSLSALAPDTKVKIGPFPEGIWGRAAGMLQVLANLVANAGRHAAPGGDPAIHVWGEDLGKQAQLYVEDNGPGVPENRRSAIFKPGVTGDTARTGLGLATVQRQLALDGGRVWVETSETLGGARFVMNIPLRSGRASASLTH